MRIRIKDVFAYAIRVITFEVRIIRRFVQTNQIGLVVDNGTGSIECAVRKFIDDHALYEKFKKNIKMIRKRFLYHNTLENLVFYIDTVNSKS